MEDISLHLNTLLQPRDSSNASSVRDYRSHCTIDTCPLSLAYYAYRPSLVANAFFLAIFSFSLLCFLVQAFIPRRFVGFAIAMICGCFLEVLGYAGRIWSYYNPFIENGFLIQIVTLTIAPAFLAAGIYLTLTLLVLTLGPSNSRIPPRLYPRIFIPCDVVSLLLQAVGGGLASSASHQNKSPDIGDHIMVAGLAFQVFTLLVFIGLAGDFALRTWRRVSAVGAEEALDARHEKLRRSSRFRGFMAALALAMLCIFVRSVYRVAELGEGWNGALIKNESMFIGFEGSIVGVAVLVLNAFHPGLCFREGDEGRRKKGESTVVENGNEEEGGEVQEKESGSTDVDASSKE